MANLFKLLRDKMELASRCRAQERAKAMLEEYTLESGRISDYDSGHRDGYLLGFRDGYLKSLEDQEEMGRVKVEKRRRKHSDGDIS